MAEEKVKEITPSAAEAEPASRALSPFEEMERLFEGFMNRGWMRPMRWDSPLWDRVPALEARMPRVDLVDRDADLLIRAEIPGIEREDLDISVTANSVTIKGETRRESKDEKGDYYRHEISRGAFARTIALPADVDAEKADAKLKEGVLELTLPKVKETRRRRIEVK